MQSCYHLGRRRPIGVPQLSLGIYNNAPQRRRAEAFGRWTVGIEEAEGPSTSILSSFLRTLLFFCLNMEDRPLRPSFKTSALKYI
jgi:hypothetical protein